MKKLSYTLLLASMGMSATVMAAVSQPPPGPCDPGWVGAPPIVPCDELDRQPRTKGKPERFIHNRNGHPGAGQRLYPAPDGSGDSCTRPWTKGPTGYPYCPGDIVQ